MLERPEFSMSQNTHMPADRATAGAAFRPRPTPSTLKSHIFTGLRDAIVSGRYRPGDRLNESQIAREFGVSRIPVREALMQLQEHGLVMNHERRGMFVTQLSEEDVQRINSLRIVLEAEALKICRARISKKDAARLTSIMEQMEAWTEGSEMDAAALDLQFHRTLWEAAGNPYLTKSLDLAGDVPVRAQGARICERGSQALEPASSPRRARCCTRQLEHRAGGRDHHPHAHGL